jgi:hypothetical protein
MTLTAAILSTALASAAVFGRGPAPATQAVATPPACVAVMLPRARGVDGDATAFSTSLRDLFMSYLTGPSIRAIALDAKLPSQAIEEARQKECDFIVLSTVTRVHHDGSGLGRALGQAAGTAAAYGIPYGGSGATAAARGAAVAGAYAVSNMSYSTKAKDEITLEYRVGTLERVTTASPTSKKAKAKQDGEDLLTPMVETASETIAAAVSKR